MIRLRIEQGFRGPSILELQRSGVLDGKPQTVEVAWGNTREEVQAIRRYPGRNFILLVPDIALAQRSALTLGVDLTAPEETIATGVKSLKSRDQSDWRAYVGTVGTPVAKALLVRFASDAIRQGKNPRKLRGVIDLCLLRGGSALEADVLLGLGAL